MLKGRMLKAGARRRWNFSPRQAGGEGRIHLQFPVAGRGKQLAGSRPAVHRKPVDELDLANIPPEVSPKTDAKSGKRRERFSKPVGEYLLKASASCLIDEFKEAVK